jgi:hypothetical protein
MKFTFSRFAFIFRSALGFALLERVRGVEPLSRSWKDRVIPLYDTRSRGIQIRTGTKSSQRTRATVTLYPAKPYSSKISTFGQSFGMVYLI